VLDGRFHTYDPTDKVTIVGTFDGIGDGLVSGFGTTAMMTRVHVRAAARAGIVFDASVGLLERVRGEGGRFGLVVQASPSLDYKSATKSFSGNDEDVLTDSELPVPTSPAVPTE
jgi:hypothetical protein